MLVRELIEQLSKMPGDVKVIMSKDGEGNAFRNLTEVELSMADFRNGRAIEVLNEDEACPEGCDGVDHAPFECEPQPEGAVQAVVLWPSY